MVRASLLILGWVIAALSLWALLVVLEVYWNLYDWQPKLDSRALGMALGVCVALAGMLLLACVRRQHAARGVSLVVCLALLGLAVYVFPREPLTSGLFARERSSPAWYRLGRFLALASPTLFWVFGVLRRDGSSGQSTAAPNGGPARRSSDSEVSKAPPSVS